jgi:two-component system, cell cycle sensor histidine kinase PleC
LQSLLIWLAIQFSSLLLSHALATKFMDLEQASVNVRRWRRIFVLAEVMQGIVWALFVALVSTTNEPTARTFVLIMLFLIAAINATITASIPIVVYAGLAPMTAAIVAFLRPDSLIDPTTPLVALACAALLAFAILAKNLYSRALDTLSFQSEKDELIAELEQAKTNSDLARRRAEEANLAKSRFLATMSHELRTPLNAILGFSEVMKSELFGGHTVSAYKEYSNDIHSSGEHLLTLINEILDLSRVEAGRFELKEEPVSLGHILEDCRHLLSLRAKKREIVIHESAEPYLPRLWADERAVRQVALNLLSNAIKFTPPGGGITIKIGWTSAGGQYFSVKDTGHGIPDEEIPVVMSSFGRGTLAQKNAEEGSGLGLPIVKGLVELHGGTFTLKSKVREGTEVIVVFPPERVMNALPQLDPDESNQPAPETKPRRRQAASRAA